MENNKVIANKDIQSFRKGPYHNNSSWRVKGRKVKKLTSLPSSYFVLTERGTILRRNRKDLLLMVPHQNCSYLKDNCSDYDDL